MKSPILPSVALLLLLFAACNNSSNEQLTSPSKPKIVLRSFTDTAKLDTFKIELKGTKPKNMELLFTITPEGGQTVYSKILKATDLLDNYKETVDLAKGKQQIKFMQEELGLFFEDENFLEPAVTENEQPDKNTPDKIFFNELKTSSLNGFTYRLGKESKVYIAWSQKDKKVKVYYQCCEL